MLRAVYISIFVMLFSGGCGRSNSNTGIHDGRAERNTAVQDTVIESAERKIVPSMVIKPSGVGYFDHVVGSGKPVENLDKVSVHYSVWLAENDTKGRLIQSSKDSGEPLMCQVGVRLITGWSDGMIGMQPGGVRELHVPSALGYGPQGMGGVIPPNADLIFEIEFLRYLE